MKTQQTHTAAHDLQLQALTNAVQGQSTANYEAIFEGFTALGIAEDDIKPRENIFTFHAWKALGRVVRKGQHGVKVITVIRAQVKDEPAPVNRSAQVPGQAPKTFGMAKPTTVFHISQTDLIDSSATAH